MAEASGSAQILSIMELARSYGPLFRLRILFTRYLLATGLAAADPLCDHRRLRKVIQGELEVVREFAGDGLFTAHTEEPAWRTAHNILLPSFSQQAVRRYLPRMAEVAGQLLERWDAAAARGEPVDVLADMTSLTLDVIGLCAFDYRFECLRRAEVHPFIESLVRCMGSVPERLMRPPLPHLADARGEERWQTDIRRMYETIDAIVAERRGSGAPHRDLLQVMLQGVDRHSGARLDDRNIRHQIITFLVAGHETTSSLLAFALYFLVKHPEVLARARAEVDRAMGRHSPPTYEQLLRLPYLVQVLKESLRLWPPAPGFKVAPYQDMVVGGRYCVARDEAVTLFLPALHRDPTVWGPGADRFDPDNFLPEREKVRPPNAYKPFGNGPRGCLGRQFAMLESLLVLALVLQRYHLLDCDGYRLDLHYQLSLKPRGFRLGLEPR
jgi:cytochrome P450/NADPH-cytochrome P450 reductase